MENDYLVNINEKFVSIIVPVYNVEKYLVECINSILNQSYKYYELILINDGSIDKSGEICDYYASNYENIIALHQENMGQAAARNLGVANAKYQWIMLVDSDDVIHPQLLEFLVRARDSRDALICACHRIEGEYLPKDFFDEKNFGCEKMIMDQATLMNLHDTQDSYYWALLPSLMHKKIYQDHKMQAGKIYEDNAICCQWLYSAKCFAALSEKMYFYRKNPNSTMNRKFDSKQLDYLWALSEQMKFFDKVSYYDLLSRAFEDYINGTIWMTSQIRLHMNDRRLEKSVWKKTMLYCRKYRNKIKDYDNGIRKIEKFLYPNLYKIKKAIKRRVSIADKNS